MIEEDIHNISVQQNDMKKIYNCESIEIEYTCNVSTTCYVCEIIQTLKFMKNEKKLNMFKIMIWIPS